MDPRRSYEGLLAELAGPAPGCRPTRPASAPGSPLAPARAGRVAEASRPGTSCRPPTSSAPGWPTTPRTRSSAPWPDRSTTRPATHKIVMSQLEAWGSRHGRLVSPSPSGWPGSRSSTRRGADTLERVSAHNITGETGRRPGVWRTCCRGSRRRVRKAINKILPTSGSTCPRPHDRAPLRHHGRRPAPRPRAASWGPSPSSGPAGPPTSAASPPSPPDPPAGLRPRVSGAGRCAPGRTAPRRGCGTRRW